MQLLSIEKLNRKKIISIFLVLILLMVLGPLVSYAQSGATTPLPAEGLQGGNNKSVLTSIINVEGIIANIADGILTFFGKVLEIVGNLFNVVIEFTVRHMSSFIKNTDGIKIAWTVMRDVANIAFIFGIVYIAISTILQVSGKGIKDLLGKLILVAILINFSFFFTTFIIDVSNLLTLSLYERILDQPEQNISKNIPLSDIDLSISNPTNTPGEGNPYNVGISGIFMQQLKIQSTLDPNLAQGLKIQDVFFVGVLGSMVILIFAVALLIVSVLFIVRLVALIIILTLSPIGYLGLAFPGMQKYSSKWWDALWGQTLFAPIYMLMTLVVVIIISDKSFRNAFLAPFSGSGSQQDLASFSEIFAGAGSVASSTPILINYGIVIGLIIASIIIAKQTSESSGGLIASAAKKSSGLVFGAAGAAGRQTFGRAGSVLANSSRVQKLQRSNSRIARTLGRTLVSTGQTAQKSNFDVRGTAIGSALSDAVGGGKATKKRDRKTVIDNYAKKRQEGAKQIGKYSDSEVERLFGGSQEYKDQKNKNKEREDGVRSKINNLKKDAREGRPEEEVKKEMEILEKELRETEQRNKKEMEKAKKDFKNKPQREYAEQIARKDNPAIHPATRAYRFVTRAGNLLNTKRRVAREKIEKDLGKSDKDKYLDALKKEAEDEVEKKEKEKKEEDKPKSPESPEENVT